MKHLISSLLVFLIVSGCTRPNPDLDSNFEQSDGSTSSSDGTLGDDAQLEDAGISTDSEIEPLLDMTFATDTGLAPDATPLDAGTADAALEDMAAASEALLSEILAVASGALTWGEVLGEGEEVVSRLGPAL